jgi:hypothetical protein
MDVVDELKTISLEQHLAKLACKEISADAAKKTHLFKVLEFSYFLEELVVDEALGQLELKKLLIFPTDNEVTPITFYLHSFKEKIVFLGAYTSSPEIINEFQQLLSDLSKTSRLEYMNCDLSISKAVEIDLKRGAGKKAIDYLLSEELKSILEYSQMQIELGDDVIEDEHDEKKIKL